MSADSALRGIFDRFAMIRKVSRDSWAGGTDFWTRVDAAADEVFENIVKGQTVTDLDTMFASADFGNQTKIAAVLNLIESYFRNPTDGAAPGLGYSTDPWNSYLEAKAFGVPWDFAELYYNKAGVRLDPQYVWAKGVYAADLADNTTACLHNFGNMVRGASTWAYTAADGALPTSVIGAPLVITSNSGAGLTAMTVTVLLQDRVTTKTIALTGLTLTAGTQVIVGAEALAENAAAAQKVVEVAATGQFLAGEWVAIVDDDTGFEEICQIDTVTANDKLTMKSNLVNAWTTAKHAKVLPLFANWTAISALTGGSEGDAVQGYALPLRTIAL